MVFVVVAGCVTKTYQVELSPKGKKIERRLTISRRERSLSDKERSELDRIARLYDKAAPRLPAKSVSFSGSFSQDLPKDVGGDGHYVREESPLGHVSVYVERFRGNDDIAGSLEAGRKAADELVDLLIGWFDSELRGVPDWPRLRDFLEKSFRSDVQNLRLYLWALKIGDGWDSKNVEAEIGFRAIEYLVERGYFTYEEGPVLVRDLTTALQRDDFQLLAPRIKRLLESHAGGKANSRLVESLGFLSDRQRASNSWRRYFAQTAYFKAHKDKVRNRDDHSDAAKSRSAAADAVRARDNHQREDEVLDELFVTAFPLFNIQFGEANQLEVSIRTPHEPFWTNGNWKKAEGRVVWSKIIPTVSDEAQHWPRICFAAWDEPDDRAQTQLFGSVRLTGEELFDYCLWYAGLSPKENQEWEAFLPTAMKERRDYKRLDEFRFSNEAQTRHGSDRAAFQGINAIKNALKPRQ